MTSAAADVDADVAIVGAGIVGASIASALGGSCRVCLLEAEAAPGMHATGRSAALYAPAYGPPAVRTLTRASRAFFDAPPPGFAATPLLSPRGALFVARAEQADGLRALHARLCAEGGDAQLIDTAATRARVPVLHAETAALALADDGALDIDVDALLQGCLRRARAQGAQLVTGARVASLAHDGHRWQIGTADGRRFSAGLLVNAAGAWADELAALAGAAGIGLQPRRRSAFVFAPPEGLPTAHWPAVIAADERWYFKPEAGLLLGSPANADPVPPHDVVAEELDIALGIHAIESATTLRIRRPRRTWAGLRSFVADGEPVCGFDPVRPGFFWAAALGGYGIQTAPAFGRLCAALLQHGPVPDDLRAQGLAPALLAPLRAGTAMR